MQRWENATLGECNAGRMQRWKNATLKDAIGVQAGCRLVVATTAILLVIITIRAKVERGVVAPAAEVEERQGTAILVVT
jgi:hypothetical protein